MKSLPVQSSVALSLATLALVAVALCSPAVATAQLRVEPVVGGSFDARPADEAPDAKAAFLAQYDDGERDSTVGGGSTVETYEAALLMDDGGAGVTLDAVEVCVARFPGETDTRMRFDVVVWAADGPGGSPGTELVNSVQTVEVSDTSPRFVTADLGFELPAGDVYVGVRYNPIIDPFGLCADYDGIDGEVQPGYIRFNEVGIWADIGSSLPDYKAFMFRSFLSTPGLVLDQLLVPSFAVDRTSPNGTTTLFAVRNLTDANVPVDLEYYTADGTLQRTDSVSLDGREVVTVNLRDVPGLVAGGDGFARGYVLATTGNTFGNPPEIAGDYFQVDVGDDFATGEQARVVDDLCGVESVRFLSFGSGTRLALWLQFPQGTLPTDPLSFTARAYDEAGNPLTGPLGFRSDDHVVELDVSDITTASNFGSVVFDFSGSGRGTVFAEYSAAGVYSIGVGSHCEDR